MEGKSGGGGGATGTWVRGLNTSELTVLYYCPCPRPLSEY